MVKSQIAPSGVDNLALLDAFLATPREEFVIASHKEFAYSDHALPLNAARRALKPLQIARLMQALAVDHGHKVLVVGAGSGYEAALLTRLGAVVFALESDSALVEQGRQLSGSAPVRWRLGTPELGWADRGPFDAILVCGSVETIPSALLSQLGGTGRLVAIVGKMGDPVMYAVRVQGNKEQKTETLFETVAFPLVTGEGTQPFRL
ncbi:MAG: protein-L-isoaspartate O-methyltransferase [Magnetococcales bacterium]|nr:protein-L-isoaspartate O-methyltransferase [Magnetococcales bacterium]